MGEWRIVLDADAAKNPAVADLPGNEPRFRGEYVLDAGCGCGLHNCPGDVAAWNRRHGTWLAEKLSENIAAHAPLLEHGLEWLVSKDIRVRVRMATNAMTATLQIADAVGIEEGSASD